MAESLETNPVLRRNNIALFKTQQIWEYIWMGCHVEVAYVKPLV